MPRFNDLAHNPVSNEYELRFAGLLQDLTNELDRMLHGYGGLDEDAQPTRAVLVRLRKPLAEAFQEYFGDYPSGYDPEPEPTAEPEAPKPEVKRKSIGLPFRKVQR